MLDFIPMVCAKPWRRQAYVDHGEKQTMPEPPKLGYNRPLSRGPAEGLLEVHDGKMALKSKEDGKEA